MTERDAFLRAIVADPADDTVRLAFADWLDEHDETERAEFIRLQIERERAGHEPTTPDLPPRGQKLLDANKQRWLGPLTELDIYDGFSAVFRRGFVECAMIHGRFVGEYAEAVRTHCPALTELEVVGVRGYGPQIASAEFVNSVRTLRLEDWSFPDDAAALAGSPHLSRLESLSLWLGSTHDEAVCRAFGAPKTLPALRRVELIQLHGGMTAGGDAGELTARADRAAALLNQLRGGPVAVVNRPFAGLFPLADEVGRNMYGGILPDGRQVLVCGGRQCGLLYFDSSGRLTAGETLDLSAALTREPEYRFQNYNQKQLMEVLAERIGFAPGTIHVREFNASTVIPNRDASVYKFGVTAQGVFEFIDGPLTFDPGEWEELLKYVRFWLHSDNFCITAANECWADGRGQIHST
jgi:uncharacterized protein (TIGR02996 family)